MSSDKWRAIVKSHRAAVIDFRQMRLPHDQLTRRILSCIIYALDTFTQKSGFQIIHPGHTVYYFCKLVSSQIIYSKIWEFQSWRDVMKRLILKEMSMSFERKLRKYNY